MTPQTGNIGIIRKKDTSLDIEDLQIKLEENFMSVKPTFHLANHGKDDRAENEFPVDCSID